jgi:hypothetical protein
MSDSRTTAEPSDTIPREWRRWAAVSLMAETPLVDVLEVLYQQGFSKSEAIRVCAEFYDSPAFEAGQWLSQQLKKTQSVLTMREQMQATVPRTPVVDRRSGLSSQEFLEEYYAKNTPVIMDDVCKNWPARTLWNPEYLVDKLGGVEVEVMSDRESDPNYEINSNQHKFMMRFDEYVAKIEVAGYSNDLYLVANNKLLATTAARPLWDDFVLDPRFLAPDPDHGQAYLWFGPGGTITPLHHDTLNVFFNQVAGHKHFILIPSLAIHRLYNNLAVYSEVDPLNPDLDRHPLFAGVQPIHFDIGPGESLFIPAGWWHHVVSQDTSLSVSFTNFLFDNNIQWVHPNFSL